MTQYITYPATFSAQPANTVLSGPVSGSPATPAFRNLVKADLFTAWPTASQVQTIEVSMQGNDSDCDGTLLKPCATVTKAYSLITDASYLKPYIIHVQPGAYGDGAIVMKPWVFISADFVGAVQINAASWAIDSAFNTALGSANSFGMKNLYIGGGYGPLMNFDFQSLAHNPHPYVVMNIIDCIIYPQISFSLRDLSDNISFLGSYAGKVTVHGGQFYPIGSTSGTDLVLDDTGVVDGQWLGIQGMNVYGNASITHSVNAFGAVVQGLMVPFGTFTVSGAGAQVYVDAVPEAVSIVAGAGIIPQHGAVGMAYTPAAGGNWVNPDPTTVQQAIDRIAAVVSVGGTVPIP